MSYFTSHDFGFHMQFENGYKVSVQWGEHTQSSNNFRAYPTATAASAEIRITDAQGKSQDPIGWLTANEVAERLQEIASINVGAKWVFDFP
tara:strand:+ start:377 stop:649 length:273 start_codon:yes stop_codon:yes gene_type:complete